MADEVDQNRTTGNRQISDAVSAHYTFRSATASGCGEFTRELGGATYGRERPRTSANVRERPRTPADARGRPQTPASVRLRLLASASVRGCWQTSANVGEHGLLSAGISDILADRTRTQMSAIFTCWLCDPRPQLLSAQLRNHAATAQLLPSNGRVHAQPPLTDCPATTATA